MEKLLANEEQLKEFLIRAKRATYAGHGAETASCRPASHDLRYAEDELMYYDSYLGGGRFSGEEALWRDNIPLWCMNYTGRVIGENFSGDFLKEALFNPPAELPLRGPALYEKDGYTYRSKVSGDMEWFEGREEILLDGVVIYECLFHGGAVK